jgi:hypothetical protein
MKAVHYWDYEIFMILEHHNFMKAVHYWDYEIFMILEHHNFMKAIHYWDCVYEVNKNSWQHRKRVQGNRIVEYKYKTRIAYN